MTTMIADPPPKTSLGVGFNANRSRSASPEAWKQKMGNKPIQTQSQIGTASVLALPFNFPF
jgi:hypothetical protein